MKTYIKDITLKVQETLDDLFNENLIPFKLTAYSVNVDSLEEHIVLFYDSRIHSITFSLKDGKSLKEVVRAAVLDCVKKMSGPLSGFRIAHPSVVIKSRNVQTLYACSASITDVSDGRMNPTEIPAGEV